MGTTACATWGEKIQELVDDALAAPERAALAEHLACCAGCRAAHDALERLTCKLETWARAPLSPPAPDLVAALGLEPVADVVVFAPPARRLPRMAAAAACSLLAAGLAVALAYHPHPAGTPIAKVTA